MDKAAEIREERARAMEAMLAKKDNEKPMARPPKKKVIEDNPIKLTQD